MTTATYIPNHYRATLTFLGVFADAMWAGHSEASASAAAESAVIEELELTGAPEELVCAHEGSFEAGGCIWTPIL